MVKKGIAMFNFVGNSLWYLIVQSDFVSKFVLLLLLGMSLLCWTIFIGKLILLYVQNRNMKRIHDMLRTVRSLEDLRIVGTHTADTIGGNFIAQTMTTLMTLRSTSPTQPNRTWDIMHYHIDQTVDLLLSQEESFLPLLSTSAAVAPLLGLFGTVWGLIHSFVRISEKQSADITVVAPGIAEALITTLAGLMVAIPALIMYNYLLTRVRHIESQMSYLADRVTFIMQQAL